MNSLSRDEVRDIPRLEIRSFILSTFLPGSEASELRDDDLLFESGIIDSTGALRLLFFLEERFDIHVKDEELFPSNFASVERILAFLKWKAVDPDE